MKNTETNRIENKEQLNEDFEQEVIAFLNYKEGGIIYVGINKNGQVVGVENTDLTQLQIKDRIKNNIQPSTLGLFDVIVETIDDKEIIKVVISSGTEKPYYLRKKGRTPIADSAFFLKSCLIFVYKKLLFMMSKTFFNKSFFLIFQRFS